MYLDKVWLRPEHLGYDKPQHTTQDQVRLGRHWIHDLVVYSSSGRVKGSALSQLAHPVGIFCSVIQTIVCYILVSGKGWLLAAVRVLSVVS